ncbi:hypothetical protein IRB23SM22_11890 [Alkalibacterium sp. s-m-22]
MIKDMGLVASAAQSSVYTDTQLILYFENPRLCRGFRIAFSVGSKKASLHDKIKLVSRPLTQIIEGGVP